MKWKLTWGEHAFTREDLTGAHVALICSLVRDSWDLTPQAGPIQLIAFLAAWLMIEDRRTLDDVLAELHAARLDDLFGALSNAEVV